MMQISNVNTEDADLQSNEDMFDECALSEDKSTVDRVLLELMNVHSELSDQRKNITRIMANVKRCYTKIERRLQQANESSKPKEPKQNGLTKPFPVSDTLCSFMSVPEGTQLARAEVTKYLHKYIKDKDLYEEGNKQFIRPDMSLKQLLNIEDEEEPLHIFKMQKKMNTHFNYNNCSV